VTLPLILRPEAEVDIQEARDHLEAVRVGLGKQVLSRIREVLTRIEKMPELHGTVWEDVRAARLKQFR
jgi:toxin ParE1/3/4